MVLTSKETDLLKDMKDQEELCIEKYGRYAEAAKCPELKTLLNSIADTEREHLKTINEMMTGKEPASPPSLSANNSECKACASVYSNEENKKCDKYLLSDLLSTEKHVSSLYNTSVFEFKSPAARKMLSHIQAEEQQHGEMIYAFMNCNNMYS
ncbi:MAG: spore coat protein [Ruminococcaceae bacterium]|nr:spore coat protein [Oscillospiraceae bacterium]